jgi:hypothetical protein
MIEESEPKFASWMRHHGKLAVLKDDEVDRLERAGAATAGDSRQDVMESMYGRADPKPIGEQKGLRRSAERASRAVLRGAGGAPALSTAHPYPTLRPA